MLIYLHRLGWPVARLRPGNALQKSARHIGMKLHAEEHFGARKPPPKNSGLWRARDDYGNTDYEND